MQQKLLLCERGQLYQWGREGQTQLNLYQICIKNWTFGSKCICHNLLQQRHLHCCIWKGNDQLLKSCTLGSKLCHIVYVSSASTKTPALLGWKSFRSMRTGFFKIFFKGCKGWIWTTFKGFQLLYFRVHISSFESFERSCCCHISLHFIRMNTNRSRVGRSDILIVSTKSCI